MKTEREKIMAKDASKQVKLMYAESFALSKQFTDQFTSFWDIKDDWMIYEKDLDVTKLGVHINRFEDVEKNRK